MQYPSIVVGTDGTLPATAAVRWAAREAEIRRLPLRVVHVLDWDRSVRRYDISGDRFSLAHQTAETVAKDGALAAAAAAPAVPVTFEVPVGHPAATLLDLSRGTDLLVLGNRGRGGFAGLLLGSVSQRLAMHAHCAVAVVRGRTDTGIGPVAVGVDDPSGVDTVLEAGFAAAADRGAGLIAIHSYLPSYALPLGRIPVGDLRTPVQDSAEKSRLDSRLALWRAKFPGLPLETVITHDSPAAALVAVSERAQLAVVGSHDHGLITGTLLGSTGLQVLHHAHCPVLVVR